MSSKDKTPLPEIAFDNSVYDTVRLSNRFETSTEPSSTTCRTFLNCK